MFEAEDLREILDEETDVNWALIVDKPVRKEFVDVHFRYIVEYDVDGDYWRLSFVEDSRHSGGDSALGPIDTEAVVEEFRGFVQESWPD